MTPASSTRHPCAICSSLTGVARARYTEQILDECFRNILKQRSDLKPETLDRTRELMRQAIPDCMVTGHEPLIDGLVLPDPDDRHVLAAAVRAGAQAIVTFNLKDFPAGTLRTFQVEAVHPDDFVLDLIDLAPGKVLTAVRKQRRALKNPPRSLPELLDTLKNNGLNQSVAKIRELCDDAPNPAE